MTTPLETVLADWMEVAQASRRTGHADTAELVEKIMHEVESAAEDYLRWLTEEDAMLRSGRSRSWFRTEFPKWERAGHGRRDGRKRFVRMCVVPQRANITAARAAGEQEAVS